MRFFIVDVFAEQKYQGNQLAVFLPDSSLSTDEMQQISKEMNFAESAFIVSGKQQNGGYDVRIFTPDVEVPFAGHPSLGTAWVIRSLFEPDVEDLVLNLGVGQIKINFASDADVWMTQKEPQFGDFFHADKLAAILQIDVSQIDSSFPIRYVTTGLPSVIVPLRSLVAVQTCSIHHPAYRDFLDSGVSANILVFSTETVSDENDLHVRVFVDDTGFPEDAATGSANGNLAGYLLEHNYFPNTAIQLRIEQGYAILRPSLLRIEAEKRANQFLIRVGGQVHMIAEGRWL